jgi:hypothetical protein
VIYAQCKVDYTGRAKSNLDYGSRLIITKPDGTIITYPEQVAVLSPRNLKLSLGSLLRGVKLPVFFGTQVFEVVSAVCAGQVATMKI